MQFETKTLSEYMYRLKSPKRIEGNRVKNKWDNDRHNTGVPTYLSHLKKCKPFTQKSAIIESTAIRGI